MAHIGAHIALSVSALVVALAVGIPLGASAARNRTLRTFSLGTVNVVRVIPSLAILTLALPYLGLGFRPALVALAVLAIPPIVVNTDLGLRSVAATVLEAAQAVGMTRAQIRNRVEWPLAMPIVFAGVRTAAVEVIASATLAAFIGGGGLGEYVVNGLANNDTGALLEGGLSVAVLALATEYSLSALGRRLAR
ncbi:MAG TPA: ABC transporter permease [Candidatus Binatia bacterium]|nr:ABC transporter permease [Candidatus Binatia bacterium]